MRKQDAQPRVEECSTRAGGMTYCRVHRQEHAACLQMAHGNLCHVCLEWHQPPRCDGKDTRN